MKKLLIITFLITLGACSSSGKKSLEKLYYRFPEATPNFNEKPIVVKRPSAMGILGNRPMVVQDADGALKQMHHNFWLDSPKVLLYNYLLKVFSRQTTDGDLVLNSQILKLEKKQDTAVLEIKFTVNDNKGHVVFNKTYHSETPLKNKSITSFSNNIGNMLQTMVKQLTQDMI
jgi:ABC-type uncharacterized transport system auxiliary subunit